MIHVFVAGKTIFYMSDFQENGFLFGTLVSANQCQHNIRNLISKLVPNWLTNVIVIGFTFFGTGCLSGAGR